MTTSSTPDRGRALLMSTAAASFVLSAALVAGPALAQNECGTPPVGGGTVTCPPNQTFPNGISYPNQTADLTLVTQSSDTATGPISVSGSARNFLAVDNSGAVTSTTDGIAVSNASSGAFVANEQGATVSGGVNGVSLTSTAGRAGLYNSGTIAGGSYSVVSNALGGTLINNYASGTINGPISLKGNIGAGNTFNNGGTWNVSGASNFGSLAVPGTTNVLNNGGTIVVTAGTPATFNNLSTFNNTLTVVTDRTTGATQTLGGTVDLTSGASLNAGSAQFNGGPGSTLRVNANSPSGTLIINSTGPDPTRVVLADVPGTNPALNLRGATIVTGPAPGTGPSFGSFNFGAPGINDQHAGFVDYRLVFNASTATTASSYTLFGLPGPEVFEALNTLYALQDFWRHPAVAVTQRQMSIRDSLVGEKPSRPDGWEFWAVPYGGEDFFKRPQIFRFGGFFFPSVGNHNDTVGLQIGADNLGHFGSGTGIGFLGIGGAGTGYWGFTGGVEQQTTHFPGDDANDIYSVGGNFGVYGGASWGGFYVNALGKVDFDNMNTNFFTAGFSPNNGIIKAYGTRGEIGYRWPWSGFFVEPSGRVNAIWTDGIDLNPRGALLHFNSGNASVDGEVGGRVGTTFNFGKIFPGPVSQFNPFPGQFNIYVGAWWARQWSGQNLMSFTTFGGVNGPTTIGLAQATTGSFIHMEYGLETADWYGGLKLFLKGTNDFDGDHVGGWQAQAGVRFSF